MDKNDLIKEQLTKRSSSSKGLWDEVRSRFSRESIGSDKSFRIIDIQQECDNIIDLIVARTDTGLDWEQVERWRFSVEKKLFQSPKIRTYFTSGPSLEEFLNGT